MNNLFCIQTSLDNTDYLRYAKDVKKEFMNQYISELREVIEAKTLVTETPEFGRLVCKAEIAILSKQEYLDLRTSAEYQANRALFKMNNHLINKENLQRKLSAKYEAWTTNGIASEYELAVAQGFEIAMNIIDELED